MVKRKVQTEIANYFAIWCRILYMLNFAPSAKSTKDNLKSIINDVEQSVKAPIAVLLKGKKSPFIKDRNLSKVMDRKLDKLWVTCFHPFIKKEASKENLSYPAFLLKVAYMFDILKKFSDTYINLDAKKTTYINVFTDGEKLAELGKHIYALYHKFVQENCMEFEDIAWYLFEDQYHYQFLDQYWRNLIPKSKDGTPPPLHLWGIDSIWQGLFITLPNAYQVFMLRFQAQNKLWMNRCIKATAIMRRPHEPSLSNIEVYKEIEDILKYLGKLRKSKEKFSEEQKAEINARFQRGCHLLNFMKPQVEYRIAENQKASLLHFFEAFKSVRIAVLLHCYRKHTNQSLQPDLELDKPVVAYCHIQPPTFQNEEKHDMSDFPTLYRKAIMVEPSRKKLIEEIEQYQPDLPLPPDEQEENKCEESSVDWLRQKVMQHRNLK